MTTAAQGGLSRRALFGAGLARALSAPPPEGTDGCAGRPPAVGMATAGEADAARLGQHLGPVAAHVLGLARLAGSPRQSVAVVAAGDGTPVAAAVAAHGHEVIAIEHDAALRARGAAAHPAVDWRAGHARRLPLADAEAGAVIAWFGATYEPDPRAVAAELRRIAAPGAAIALVAWTPQAQRELTGPPAGHRPEQWSRYETAYRHFFGLDGLDVVHATVERAGEHGSAPAALDYAAVIVRG